MIARAGELGAWFGAPTGVRRARLAGRTQGAERRAAIVPRQVSAEERVDVSA